MRKFGSIYMKRSVIEANRMIGIFEDRVDRLDEILCRKEDTPRWRAEAEEALALLGEVEVQTEYGWRAIGDEVLTDGCLEQRAYSYRKGRVRG